jgi:hypothetical protein
MTEKPDNLEHRITELLRHQPLRHAPPALEARVLASLGGRVKLPWWRTGFTHWPLVARVGFLFASYGFVRLALAAAMAVAETVRTAGFSAAQSPAMEWVHTGASFMSAAAAANAFVARTIPVYWLYGAAAAGLVLYGVLFGLGTVAYRTLYVDK